MIDKIQITGFQSHKDTEITLDTGVNVIIGSSDSGKSSIIRALKWLFQNRPQGDSFKNNELKPKDEVSVCSVFENGEYMSRERSSKCNQYATFEDITYKALRTDVPPDVQDMTRMKDVNIQSQHPNDQYFLLTDSPGAVAKKFNEVSGLEIMDKAMLQINKQYRACNSEIKVIDTEIETKQTEFNTLKWIPKASKAARVLNMLYKQIQTQKDTVLDLQDILIKIQYNEVELIKYKPVDTAEKDLQKIDETIDTTNELMDNFDNLQHTVNRLDAITQQIKAYAGMQKARTSLKQHIKTQETISMNQSNISDLHFILEGFNTLAIEIKEQNKDIDIDQKEFNQRLKKESCPVCGRK